MSLSPGPSSPASFTMSLGVSPSTSMSSPPATKNDEDEEPVKPVEEEGEEARWTRLEYLLEKSAVYSRMLKERMDFALQRQRQLDKEAADPHNEGDTESVGQKRHLTSDGSSTSSKRKKTENGSAADCVEAQKLSYKIFEQPRLVSGTKLKDYQLEGVAWMAGLHENGISGILADDMGLGKTLQTIAFAAYLRGRMSKPFLVVCPLSVLYNWISEFKKFAPQIPVCMYHGTPAERAELRQTDMDTSLLLEDYHQDVRRRTGDIVSHEPPPRGRGQRGGRKGKSKGAKKGTSRKIKKSMDGIDDESADKDPTDLDPEPEAVTHKRALKNKFPVVVTTYELVMKDRAYLTHYQWGFIVVDEGHRLKNMDCKLMREIKHYESAGRMVLTGTPLQNNLAELWSLLNFILPDIFHDLDSFQEWFNLPTLQTSLPSSRSTMIISTLQAIIKPFLLRRLKVDVEKDSIPPKKEYVIYAPLTENQREIYDSVVEGELRAYLLKTGDDEAMKAVHVDLDAPMELRSGKGRGNELESEETKTKMKVFDILDGDDDEYFELLQSGKLDDLTKRKTAKDAVQAGQESYHKMAKLKQVNNMKLQNTVMQLRKVCSHPFLFDWPINPDSRQPIVDENLVNASGKMMLLERLLDELFARGHKVLLFSQFTMMLDIIEDWAWEFKGWPICRIDGSTSALERRDQVDRFQGASGDDPDAPKLFLLSTRAGGMGLNLTAADTVIFYDQDWNPQMDLQAQDRCHRIGQTKPVLVFRLVTAHTIETKIMQRAAEKRQLETLVIAKGKFRMPAQAADKPAARRETMAKMAADLLKLEGEQIQIVPSTAAGKKAVALSDEELNMLLDRNLTEMANRGTGWNSAGAQTGEAKKAAFAVFNAPAVSQDNGSVSELMGESMSDQVI